jgi:hypothetical protein
VSQEECAKLRESVPYVKVYPYNPKHLYPKLNGYRDNGQRKVWSSCGSTYRTCSADTSPVHCACPSLRVSLLPTLRLRYEQLVTCTEMPCSLKWMWYTFSPERVCHVKCLETLRTTVALMRVFMLFNLMALCHSYVNYMLSTDINITETTYSCQF